MDNLAPGMFVVPAVALSLIVMGYHHFRRKVQDRSVYRQLVIAVAASAFLLNFAWEVAQGPLYKNFRYDWKHISFCALASVADMLMVLVLLFGFGIIYKSAFWIRHLSTGRMAALMLTGGAGAILSEMWHTARGDWYYAEAMPLLPGMEAGLTPVLQFTILPLISFMVSRKITDNRYHRQEQ